MKKIIIILVLIFGFVLQHSAQTSIKKADASKLDGRWSLTFSLPQQSVDAVADFKVSADGNVKAEFLNLPGGLIIKSAVFVNDQLKLNAQSQFGAVTITAKVDGDEINGTFELGSRNGIVKGKREAANKSKVDRLAVFDKVWQTINDGFYDPNFNDVDWQAMRAKYRPLSERATTDGEFSRIVNQMLKELKVSHLYFGYSPNGDSLIDDFDTTKSKNSNAPNSAVTWKVVAPDAGYLRISKFVEDPEALKALDQAFAEIGKFPNLIVDVRGNGGGTLSLAMRLGDYLLDKPQILGFFAARSGLKRYNAQSINDLDPSKLPTYSGYTLTGFRQALDKNGAVSIISGGRAAKPYRGRIVMLINERCGSTTEGLLAVIKEKKIATLVGRKTAGAMLSGIETNVGGNWQFFYPNADFRTFKKMKVEGIGVEPDIFLDKQLTDEQVLKRAIDVLKAQLAVKS